LANYVCSIISIIGWLDVTIKTIIWVVAASVIFTSFLMFATQKKVADAYKVKLLFDKSGDLLIILFILLIQLAFINIPTAVLIGYIMSILLGPGEILNAYIAYMIVFNIAAIGHYMAQVHYDVLEKDLP
jgi:hypothetical protein